MKAPPRSPRYWPVVAILGITMLLICGGGFLAAAIAGRRLVDRISMQAAGGPADDVFEMMDSWPQAKGEEDLRDAGSGRYNPLCRSGCQAPR